MKNQLVLDQNSSREVKIIKVKKEKGFTLIELIAVIAILAILAAVLIPNVTGYMTKAKNRRANSDANIVLTAIQAYNAENDPAVTKFSAIPVGSQTNFISDPTKIDPDIMALTIAELTTLSQNAALTAAEITKYTDGIITTATTVPAA